MSILLTGGAGYIGSHVARYFTEMDEDIIIVDNLQSGYEEALSNVPFYRCDIRDINGLSKIFEGHDIDAVIHFAANSLVGESMSKPYEYFHNNVYGMLCLLGVMREAQIDKIVFSSSAAVYGEPKNSPISENNDLNPTNVYGETKLMMENMMKWFERAYGIKYISLRYFNAAGAHQDGDIGEDHRPETHLIPLVLQVPLGLRENITVFGDDYPTRDGTCIRDYIHVVDLASAHFLAYGYLKSSRESNTFNLGNGEGFTVNEVIEMARRVTGHDIPSTIADRRVGDPAVLVASSSKAESLLKWVPRYGSLEKIIADAWNWHSTNPNGYSRFDQ